jgi:transketolase
MNVWRISSNVSNWWTVEEHSIIGGLGSAVAEWLAGKFYRAGFCSFGTPDRFLCGTGSQLNARKIVGLTPEDIAEGIYREL